MTRHATFDEIHDASEQMSLAELSKLCNDLAIIPSLLTMEDLRYHVFQDSSSAWESESDFCHARKLMVEVVLVVGPQLMPGLLLK